MSSVLRSQNLNDQGFRHGFSTRRGGVSQGVYSSLNLGRSVGDDPAAVAENQRRFAAAVGYEPERLFEINQVHGNAVRVLRADDSLVQVRNEPGDGLVARDGAAIAVRSADCVPILLADPVSRGVAALHAGWRGCVAGVVPAGVQALRMLAEADAGRLVAALFPHIRACCFEVGPDVAGALAAAASGAAADQAGVVEARGDKPHVSLERLIFLQLVAAGVPAARIELLPGCTRCDAQRFFSYRRDGRISGRHVTAIVSA